MPLNLIPERVSPRGLQINQRAIEHHLIDDHYVRGFTPGEFVLDNGALATFLLESAAAPRWSTINMPDAVNSFGCVTWRKPTEWRTGQIRLRYWYTSDVGSTNNFFIQTGMYSLRDGELLAANTLMNINTAVPGPAVALTAIRSAYVYTTTALGSDDELFSLRIQRLGGDASDTNVNDFSLLYVEIEHIPAQQVSQ